VRLDAAGKPAGLKLEDEKTTIEPITPEKRALLRKAATGEEFLKAWKWNDWNEFRIRVEGASPRLTSHINGALIAEVDTATMKHPNYDAEAVLKLLGRKGHIAFEVHNNDTRMGEARWGKHAACRWRNIRVREL
jgi:hypothetical protein